MTQNYNVGDRVKIVRSDYLFNDELGDQTGMVGKVKLVPSHKDGVYIKFKGTKRHFYYTNVEVQKVPNPTPAPEPVKEYHFRAGDNVRYVGPNRNWRGSEFTVDADVEKFGYGYRTIRLTATKVSDSLKREGYKVGSNVGLDTTSVEKFTPAPEPKFKLGDWVKVTGYSEEGSTWEGFVGEVMVISQYADDTYIIDNHKGGILSSGGFQDKYLVAAEKPWSPKFKIGDWVEITGCCGSSECDGAKLKITAVPTDSSYPNYSTEGGKYTEYNEKYLKLTTEPEEPHWTEAKPVGTATRIGARTLVKVEEDKWLFVYDTNSTRPSVNYRTNREAKGLFFSETPEFITVY